MEKEKESSGLYNSFYEIKNLNNLTNNSYAQCFLDNTFIVFNSNNNIFYLTFYFK